MSGWIANAIRDLPPLCTAKEAATFLRISERTLARYLASKALRCVKLRDGGRVLIARDELARFLEEHKQ